MNYQNQNIRLTLAIPTFNRADFLRKNLQIIFSQLTSTDKVEIIIIDNASTDNTGNVCQKYFNFNNFLYVRLDQNLGMSASQYECLVRANGDYVCILSDDDFLQVNGIKLNTLHLGLWV